MESLENKSYEIKKCMLKVLLVSQVEQDDEGSYSRTRSHHRGKSQQKTDPLGEDRQMIEDARLVNHFFNKMSSLKFIFSFSVEKPLLRRD